MQAYKKTIHILLLGYVVLSMLVGYMPVAQAQLLTPTPASSTGLPEYKGVEDSIRAYLCTPDNATETVLFECVNKLYRFGIAFGAIALVFFLVLAGYSYMLGGETGKQKGKSIFLSALTGMGIILTSYILLSFINPDLVKFKPITPPQFKTDLPGCEKVTAGVTCTLPDGTIGIGDGRGGGTPAPGGGVGNENKYKPLIQKYAQLRNIEYCALSALLQKESSYNNLIVSNAPPNMVDIATSPPTYNVNFERIGHGIGLTQVYIYERARGSRSGWANGVPARSGGEFGFSKPLYVKDLIDPEISIQAGSYYWANLIRRNNGNLYEAYRDYQGPASKEATLRAYMDMYNACKLRK